MKTIQAFIFITAFLTLFQPIDSYAHPGRTASDGCHYCRTNCAKWGEVEGARHCHGGYTAPAPTNNSYSPPKTTCPANSTYNSVSNDCTCKSGYVTSLSKTTCVKIPFNAHAVNSNTDVWECDAGYTEVGNICEKIKPPEIIDESTGSVEGAETDTEVEDLKVIC